MLAATKILFCLHALVWASFVLTRLVTRKRSGESPTSVAAAPARSRYPSAIILLHSLAFSLLYSGIYFSPYGQEQIFSLPHIVGAVIVVLGMFVMSWAMWSFRSWRLRAQLDQGHQLATGGPFRYVRHPIYLGLDLLALGSAIWLPIPLIWFAFALMCVSGDIRGRAEERLLLTSFGADYQDYKRKTSRFLPGIY